MIKIPQRNWLKKPQKKGKGKKVVEPVVAQTWEDVESFFTIFESVKDDLDKLDFLKQDADFFREDLVPNAMEYYLDIMANEGDDYNEEDEEGEEDEDEPQLKPKKDSKSKKDEKPNKGTDAAPTKGGEGTNPDDKKCNNQ